MMDVACLRPAHFKYLVPLGFLAISIAAYISSLFEKEIQHTSADCFIYGVRCFLSFSVFVLFAVFVQSHVPFWLSYKICLLGGVSSMLLTGLLKLFAGWIVGEATWKTDTQVVNLTSVSVYFVHALIEEVSNFETRNLGRFGEL